MGVKDDEFRSYVIDRRGELLRTATLLTAGDRHQAEDLVQTTLTKLYVAWPRVRRVGNPVGYARTSLTHAFVDETRRGHRRHETSTDRVTERAMNPESHDLSHAVLAALADLAPRQRAVVVLRHWLDLDIAETARIMSCSIGTVKSQNAKALDRLRTVLEPHITLEELR